MLEEALEVAHRSGEEYCEAELYRIKGEGLLMQPTGRAVLQAATGGKTVGEAKPFLVAQAEDCFNQAIKIAQQHI